MWVENCSHITLQYCEKRDLTAVKTGTIIAQYTRISILYATEWYKLEEKLVE